MSIEERSWMLRQWTKKSNLRQFRRSWFGASGILEPVLPWISPSLARICRPNSNHHSTFRENDFYCYGRLSFRLSSQIHWISLFWFRIRAQNCLFVSRLLVLGITIAHYSVQSIWSSRGTRTRTRHSRSRAGRGCRNWPTSSRLRWNTVPNIWCVFLLSFFHLILNMRDRKANSSNSRN